MKAIVYLTIAAFMWGLNFHLLKIMLSSVHFIEAGFWRYLFALIVLILYIKKPVPQWSVFKSHIKGTLIVGVLGLFCFNILLFWGLMYTSSINASLIISLNPIVTIFLASLFLDSRISFQQLLGALVGIIGVLYLLSKGNLLSLNQSFLSKGDFLILLAMLLSGFYHIWVKKYSINISNQHFTFLSNLICFTCFVVVAPYFIQVNITNYSLQFWIASFLFGSFGTAFTYILWNKGLGIVGASKAGIFMNIVPFSTALIAIFFGEIPTNFHIISGTLIFLGLLISQFKATKTKN